VARLPIRDDLQKMEGYHSAQVTVPVRLNTNESPYPPPAEFTAELGRRIADIAWNRYPDRTASALRAAIARSHGVGVDQVFAGNGSNEILQTLLLAYAGAGRKVLTFEPTYDQSKLAGVFSAYKPDVTFVCSPNNPTGVVEDEETVRAIIDAAPGLVIVDEAYAQFASWSAVDLVDESRALVVTRTYSKTWSMAAARLGYLVGPKWLVEEIDAVVLPYHLDAAKQIAGALALEFTNDMNSRVREIVASRDQIESAFSALPVDFWPSGANFILFRPLSMDGRKVWSELVEKGVLIRDCSSWPGLTNCLRVTIGTPEENDLFLKSLSEVL